MTTREEQAEQLLWDILSSRQHEKPCRCYIELAEELATILSHSAWDLQNSLLGTPYFEFQNTLSDAVMPRIDRNTRITEEELQEYLERFEDLEQSNHELVREYDPINDIPEKYACEQ